MEVPRLESGSNADYFYTFKGHTNGGHQSIRVGKFAYCPIRIGCFYTRYPRIKHRVHYDRTASANHNVG